ncbi:FUSC family protein [Leucobacter ruminantium]|uniref:FUSC family protein n=1 Tax=Leucobacter ruminantium TaxID=1289170 RepID=A0A939RZN7_9MICO|nr:FUSC family protein [Leucobacter ruminantium]MBO1805674.1 FUSC family protein [Leucobacter ruminantium]
MAPLLLLVVSGIPALAIALTPLASGLSHVLAGTAVGIVGSLYGRPVGLSAVTGSTALIALAGLAAPWPLAAAALMAVTGVVIGACARRGWHPAAVQASAWPATLLIAARFGVPGFDWTSHGAGQILTPALLAALGGLWAVALAALAGARFPRFAIAAVDPLSARLYGAALAVLLGGVAFVAATWLPGSLAGWALLSILVIVKPGLADTRQRLLARSFGTMLGGLLAAGIALLAPAHGVQVALGGTAMLVALGLYATGASYAGYAFALTTAIVLLSSTEQNVLAVDLQRVGLTLAAAVLVAALAAVYEPVLRAVLRKRGADVPGSLDE